MEWIKISDKKPNFSDWVIFTNGFEVTTGYYDTFAYLRSEDDMGKMTHWMPFPSPPESEQDQKSQNDKELYARIEALEEKVGVLFAMQIDKFSRKT